MHIKKLTHTCILILILSGCLSCSYSEKLEINEYEMFRGNLHHTGIYPSADVTNKPGLHWRFKTNGYITSSAAIKGDQIFFGSSDGYLYCLNLLSGSLIWKFKTNGAVHSSPAIADDEVFFGSHDGNFYAVNARDGKLKWTFKTSGEKFFPPKEVWHKLELSDSRDPDRWDTWLSSPAIKNNTVYFGSGDGNFYALDKTTGKEKWRYETHAIIHSSPALAFGNVYFGGWDTFLHVLDEETGEEKWKFKTGEDTVEYNQTGITSSPVIVDSILYFGCRDSNIYALKALSGELIWKRYNDDIWVSSTPLVYEDKVLYPAGRPNKFIALNKLTGDSVYMHKTQTGTSSSFSLAGKTVYYGDLNGVLNAHDITTGKLIWAYQIPTSAEDTLHMINEDFTTSQEGFAAAVEKYKGIRGRNELRFALGAIHSSPVIKDQVIYFGSYDGYFYALK